MHTRTAKHYAFIFGLLITFLALSALPTLPANAHKPDRTITAPQTQQLNNRLILADYMMWYQPDVFDGTKSFDVPAAGGYNSDDMSTIQMHLALSQRACLNGFIGHWFGAKEPRTTDNFGKLLQASSGSNLQHSVVILENSLRRATEQDLIDSVNFVMANWANHPNYLKIDGRPVIFFEGMTRPWSGTGAAKRGWERVRKATDPDRKAIWFAEGLSATYNPLFDGLYVYRIDHKTAPRNWLKQPAYAAQLRAAESSSGVRLYFADTIAPGFDDTRSVKVRATDVRMPAPGFARDRREGGYYRDTFSVTDKTNGDLLLVKSFNEWIEGTAIEPGSKYGDLYLNLTCELAAAYRAVDVMARTIPAEGKAQP
jgi:hypothetical protein